MPIDRGQRLDFVVADRKRLVMPRTVKLVGRASLLMVLWAPAQEAGC